MPKLNYDCIRDVLLTVQNLDFDENFECDNYQSYDKLNKYSKAELDYHILKLDEQQYIDTHIIRGDGFIQPYLIKDLSWNGHDFLNALGNEKVYHKTKGKVMSTVGSVSLEIFKTIAIETSKDILGIK